MTIKLQIALKNKYLASHKIRCRKTDWFHSSFPYCSEGYVCKSHCVHWFALYYIDFERYHVDDPNKIIQLTLF